MTGRCVICGKVKLLPFLEQHGSVLCCVNWDGCRARSWRSLRGAKPGRPKPARTMSKAADTVAPEHGQLELLG